MSRKVLVAYATKMGATAGIAEAIGAELERGGHQVDVREVGKVNSIEEYDVVVLGSALYTRRWRPEAVRFLRKHSDELRERQVWLFHSGPVGPDKDQPQAMPGKVERLAHRIGATAATTFGGRLEPATAKGFLAERMARSDIAGDSRDWETIRAWAADVSAAVHAIEAAPWNRHIS
ncbi:menaquinone-dependent protoporphyrinogen oxidase [Kribbella voronezhensis]|uniref:Menaquinone-dependent protoporphyrinogen oxidase n=1 Tax=Kribbella voronezhensis TaxID=2512212 RepID=A0A4R7SWX2_9ACTN|nr:flavodoxin domain-containing protein [Kribbella voronezhensis]TDU83754.1 menaquinone-dependent protoporphyrinogen oxidase [Kribbella voronezhensis]